MPCFNSEQYISDAIESVINQTFDDWELLIADDGSTDNSFKVASRYQKRDTRIHVLQNNLTKGASGARNTCLEHASGRYIAFLDSDDLWLPEKLALQLDFMMQGNISFSFSYYDVIDENDLYVASYKAPRQVDAYLMRFSNFIPCLTVMYDSNILGKVKQPNIKKRNDFALWLKILNSEDITFAYCLPFVTAKYRTNSYGLSSNKFGTLYYYKKCLIDFGEVSLIKANMFLALYIILGFIKAKFSSLYNYLIIRL